MTALGLDSILMKIEEIKIPRSEHIIPVIVPIHPKLIEDKTLKFDPDLAYKEHVFVKAVKSWRAELEERYKQQKYEDANEKALCKIFLEGELELKKQRVWEGAGGVRDGGYEVMPGDVENGYIIDERGFARCFFIEQGHGSIGFDAEYHRLTNFYPGVIDFSTEKLEEYAPTIFKKTFKEDLQKGCAVAGYAYTPHNTFNMPLAMFLRQWAVAYVNECLKQIFS